MGSTAAVVLCQSSLLESRSARACEVIICLCVSVCMHFCFCGYTCARVRVYVCVDVNVNVYEYVCRRGSSLLQ